MSLNFILFIFLTLSVIILHFFYEKRRKQLLKEIEKLTIQNKTLGKTIANIAVQANRLEGKLLQHRKISETSFPMSSNEINDNHHDSSTFPETGFDEQLELNIRNHFSQINSSNSNYPNFVLTWEILLKALNFPDDSEDEFGFKALRLANQNKTVAELLQASEDFLNLLAQDGIYLDDLHFDQPSVDAWRNFISRNKSSSGKKLHCVGIESHIDALYKRMKSDTVFKDTALILIRRFDQLLREKLPEATDQQVFSISNTRTGKAFLIIGKISEIF